MPAGSLNLPTGSWSKVANAKLATPSIKNAAFSKCAGGLALAYNRNRDALPDAFIDPQSPHAFHLSPCDQFGLRNFSSHYSSL